MTILTEQIRDGHVNPRDADGVVYHRLRECGHVCCHHKWSDDGEEVDRAVNQNGTVTMTYLAKTYLVNNTTCKADSCHCVQILVKRCQYANISRTSP